MGAWRTALDNLAAVTVSGVTSYALDDTPERLGMAQLPALVIVLELGGGAAGLEPNPFSAGAGLVDVRIAHLLLAAPVASGLGMRGVLPALVDAADVYLEALAADPTLGGALAGPLRVGVRVGVVHYGGVDYHAVTFLHTWTLRLT